MYDEYDAIIKSGTYNLVPRPENANIIRLMWLHNNKFDAERVFKKQKSRLIYSNGKTQE